MPSPELRVCFVGDSITAGVGDPTSLGWVGRFVAAARADGLDVTGHNLGVRRETGPQVAARWRAEAEPRLRHGDGFGVVLAVGVNDTTERDGAPRVPEAETVVAVERVAEQADTAGWRVLVVGPSPVADDDWRRDGASRDGAHPTATGYERVAALIDPPFRTWLDTLVP